MKTNLIKGWFGWLAMILVLVFSHPSDAADPVTETFQRGLFEEEANQDLSAAMKAYEEVVAQLDRQRRLAATAVFRLGECYRKLGRTNDAALQYERLLREFSDQETLQTLARQNLAGMGVSTENIQTAGAEDEGGRNAVRAGADERLTAEARELDRMEEILVQLQGWELEQLRKLIPKLVPDAEFELLDQQYQSLNSQLQQARLTRTKESLDELHTRTDQVRAMLVRCADAIINQLKQRVAMLQERVAEQDKEKAVAQTGQVMPGETPATPEEAMELQQVQALIRQSPDLINAQSADGLAPLHRAAARGYVTVARFLLDHGAKIDLAAEYLQGRTPLQVASEAGQLAMVELLLGLGAAVDARDKHGDTALHMAASRGFQAVAEVLLGAGADVNAKNHSRSTPLHRAVGKGFVDMSETLLEHGASIEAREANEFTPLLWAAHTGEAKVMAMLLERGADVNAASLRGSMTSLHVAARSGYVEAVKVLLDHGAELDGRAAEGNTPLLLACIHAPRQRQLSVMEALLAHGADPDAENEAGYRPIYYVIDGSRDLAALKLLLNANVNVDWRFKRNGFEMTPLIMAIAREQADIVRQLLEAEADVNLAGGFDRTPLHMAVGRMKVDYVQWLLERGADINAIDAQGKTPLDYAEEGRQLDSNGNDRQLIQLAGSSGGRSSGGASATHEIIAKILLEHGALEWVPRPGQLTVTRRRESFSKALFFEPNHGMDQITLLELIAASALGFPDFARITITRRDPKTGEIREFTHDASALMEQKDCQANISLVWGDMVNVPEREHALNANWEGYDPMVATNMMRCLTRTVTLVVRGQSTNVVLSPRLSDTPPHLDRAGVKFSGVFVVNLPFRLQDLLNQHRHLMLNTSDLSRIKLVRKDPGTGEAMEVEVNYAGGNGPHPYHNNPWLQDGDIIEVPDVAVSLIGEK